MPPGRPQRKRPQVFGAAPGEGRECPEPEGVKEAKFLDEPEQLNVCDSGSGSGGSGGGCEIPSGGNCGVAGVYCQGNQLVVIYTTPFTPPVTGTWYCTKVIAIINCDDVTVGQIYCKEWPLNSNIGDIRDTLCPTGYGVVTEQIEFGPYETEAMCTPVCTTTTTTTTPPP